MRSSFSKPADARHVDGLCQRPIVHVLGADERGARNLQQGISIAIHHDDKINASYSDSTPSQHAVILHCPALTPGFPVSGGQPPDRTLSIFILHSFCAPPTAPPHALFLGCICPVPSRAQHHPPCRGSWSAPHRRPVHPPRPWLSHGRPPFVWRCLASVLT
jgi:hypothetical protein